jgi:hypothetical protein
VGVENGWNQEMNVSEFIPQGPFGPDCCFHPQTIVDSYLCLLEFWLVSWFTCTHNNMKVAIFIARFPKHLQKLLYLQSKLFNTSRDRTVNKMTVSVLDHRFSFLGRDRITGGKVPVCETISHLVWYKGLCFAEISALAPVQLHYVVYNSTFCPHGNSRRTQT